LIAILVSVISAFYYLKIIKIVFSMPNSDTSAMNYNVINVFKTKSLEVETLLPVTDVSAAVPLLTNIHSFLIGVFTIFIITFIFNPELLLNSIAIINSLFFI